MGRFIDLDSPLSQVDRDYLVSRGRGYLIHANERRFGTPEQPREPEDHEQFGAPAQSPFYDTQERDKAVYDVGGAPLPGTVLDHDTGRVFDRENGVELVEPQFGTPSPGLYANDNPKGGPDNEGFGSTAVDGEEDIDEDIVEEVTGLGIREVESRLKEEGIEPPEREDISDYNVDQLKDRLNDLQKGFNPDDKKPELQKKLKDALAKERLYQAQERLAVHLHDKRRQGNEGDEQE